MARFAIGKGKKQRYWDVHQMGRVLRAQEIDSSDRLPGYRTFKDEQAARAELLRLAGERLDEQFEPADDAARELAAAIGGPVDPASVPATLPFRQDVHVYNEATGFMVTSMSMAGSSLDEGSKKWNKAVTDGKMIPITLVQDDSFLVRVVAGDELTAQENEEWVARLDWALDVPDGELAITGGAAIVNEQYDESDDYYLSFLRVVKVPPGRYRASVFSYMSGVNGDGILESLADRGRAEPYGKWFRRSRPGAGFPPWLHDWCVGDPANDPGHEKSWRGAELTDDEKMPEYVHFLVHLTPDSAAQPGNTVPEGGWFEGAENARKPDRCPLGLIARDVIGHEQDGAGPEWIYVHDVDERVQRFTPAAIDGGPVDVPAALLGDLYRVAWFSHRRTLPALHATLPEGAGFTIAADWPAESVPVMAGRELRVAFSSEVMPANLIPILASVGRHLETLPNGTPLELSTAQVDSDSADETVPVGMHRYRGIVQDGTWRVADAFPPMDAAMLRDALRLSAELTLGEAITVKDAAEGAAIIKWATKNFTDWADDNPATLKGTRLVVKHGPGALALYGAATFAVRFGAEVPVFEFGADDDF
jgi:hypothetical protein